MNKNPMNAFTPSSEITDIHRFAGRQKELEKLSIALQTEGAQIVIFGDRGIGKSSLARILENLARNDTDIIARLPQPPFQRFEYDVIFFTCEDSIEDIPTLLARLLNTTFLGSWV
ncbi:MAG: ATP-binding protein, partial [Achromobacter sp.]|nr:ATP-binding protein [Achromobacter sp.]